MGHKFGIGHPFRAPKPVVHHILHVVVCPLGIVLPKAVYVSVVCYVCLLCIFVHIAYRSLRFGRGMLIAVSRRSLRLGREMAFAGRCS